MVGGEAWRPFDVGGNELQHGLVLLYQLGGKGSVKDIPIAGGLTTAVSFSSDSKLLGTQSMPQSRSVPGGTVIYDVAEGNLLAVIPKAGSSSGDELRFLPWGRTVATTGTEGIVSFWKVAEP
jgi:WD40 repeat protein